MVGAALDGLLFLRRVVKVELLDQILIINYFRAPAVSEHGELLDQFVGRYPRWSSGGSSS